MTSPSISNVPTPPSWPDTVRDALEDLGGQAHLNVIYSQVKEYRTDMPETWRATVRRTLQQHPLIVQDAAASGTWRLVQPAALRVELNLRDEDMDVLSDAASWHHFVLQALQRLDYNANERAIFAMVKKLRVAMELPTPGSYRRKVRKVLLDSPTFGQSPDNDKVWQLHLPDVCTTK